MMMSEPSREPACPDEIAARERQLLAPYAMHSAASAGRVYPETLHAFRGPFQRDRDRVVHSSAFRRLSHKTQVFTGELGDHHRSRLTHTLEVASVARTIGRALRLNEDLIEALALAHDLGHPPFGHAGERTLAECLAEHGGFSHNRQGLRIVEVLERRYAGIPGLNLSIEVLDCQRTRAEKSAGLPSPLLEAQVVDAADSIVYDTHDADDALSLGLLTLGELLEVPLWQEARRRVARRQTDGDDRQQALLMLHELIEWQVGDLVTTTRARLAQSAIETAEMARQCPVTVRVGDDLSGQKHALEAFLFERVYCHPRVLEKIEPAQEKLRYVFNRLCQRSELLPAAYRGRRDEVGIPRSVADYVAGMTDRYALRQYAQIVAGKPDL
jgi:dGTPase